MPDQAESKENPKLLTVPVQRRPGYRTFPVATLMVQGAPEGNDVLMIDALLYRREEWSCLATIFIPRAALRTFLRGASLEHRGQKAPTSINPSLRDVRDRSDHQVIAASGIVLRQPETNPYNRFFYVDCLADTSLIIEEHFTQKDGLWVPAGQGKQVFVREAVGTLIVQEPALVAFYRDVDAATTVTRHGETAHE